MQQQKTAIAFMALVVAMGGFLLAFDASVILGVIKFMEPAFNLSKIKLGRAVAFVSLSATAVMIIAWTLRGKYELIGLKYLALLNASTVIITETGGQIRAPHLEVLYPHMKMPLNILSMPINGQQKIILKYFISLHLMKHGKLLLKAMWVLIGAFGIKTVN